jgi:hypothetical protein
LRLLRNPLFWNALVFQIGWFLCVAGGDVIALGAALIGLLIHGIVGPCRPVEWLCIGLAALLGIMLDSALHSLGVLQFNAFDGYGVPLWLVALWLLFASTLNSSLRWLQTRPLWAAACGVFVVPLSYWAGTRLGADGVGAASFGLATPVALAILALAWGLLLPLLSAMMRLAATRRIIRQQDS